MIAPEIDRDIRGDARAALARLLDRRSVAPRLTGEPGPSDDDLATMIDVAVRAADHGNLRPWRFITVRGDARARLGEIFAQARRVREPEVSEAELDKERLKPLRAPLVLCVGVEIQGERISAFDQILAAGAAAMNLLNAAHLLGYGAMWLTGANAHDPNIQRALGLSPAGEIVGFLYIGSIREAPMPKTRLGGLPAMQEWNDDLTPPGATALPQRQRAAI